jgi:hypothetical protein
LESTIESGEEQVFRVYVRAVELTADGERSARKGETVPTTFLDIEANAAYTRQRVAELRAMSRDGRCAQAMIVSRRPVFSSLRSKLGSGLIALGQRLSGMSVPQQGATPPAARLSSS